MNVTKWHHLQNGSGYQNGHGYAEEDCQRARVGICRVAPMIESAEAEGGVVVIVSLGVKLLDSVEGVLAELDIFSCRFATLIFIGRDVGPERFQIAQTISRHHDIRSFSFNDLNGDIIST